MMELFLLGCNLIEYGTSDEFGTDIYRFRYCTDYQHVLPNTTICEEVMEKSKVALSKEDLRARKIHWKFLMDILRYYRYDPSGSENYLVPLAENYFSCKEKLYLH